MKKKVCKWLDSNEWGALHARNSRIYACANRAVPLLISKEYDYSKLTLKEIQDARKKLFKDINNGTRKECNGCKALIEKDEENIDIGKIEFLIFHPHTTCNLKCCYCYYQNNEQGAKLEEKQVYIFPAIKNFHDIGLFKHDRFTLDLGGGEPLLLNGIEETLNFLQQNYQNPSFVLVSNSSLKNNIPDIIKALSNKKEIYKTLHTSIDCGTAETYKKIRNRDLFYDVINNIFLYAKNSVFNNINLKYILLEDKSNTSDKDIYGFANICKLISENNPHKTTVIIDADLMAIKSSSGNFYKTDNDAQFLTYLYRPINDDMLQAAGKIYYFTHELLGLDVNWLGGRLSERSDVGLNDIERIKGYAKNYANMPKTSQEDYYINLLSSKYCDKMKDEIKLNFK